MLVKVNFYFTGTGKVIEGHFSLYFTILFFWVGFFDQLIGI